MLEKILSILGILSLGYFSGIVIYTGLSSKFPIIWATVGILCLGVALLIHQKIMIPIGVRMITITAVSMFLVLFLIVEGFIVKAMIQKPEKNLDYIIVLGAQVKGNKPSLSLWYRIEEAAKYLEENPSTKAILSGGKGIGEEISEAQCMMHELEKKGIKKERLYLEDCSTNTKENIELSYKIIRKLSHSTNKDTYKIGIVTNGFHIFRGTSIAKKKMAWEIYGIPAKSNGFLQLNYMTREFFGVIKDKLAGNL